MRSMDDANVSAENSTVPPTSHVAFRDSLTPGFTPNEKDNIDHNKTAVIAPVVGQIRSWVADTGSSVDVVDGHKLSRNGLRQAHALEPVHYRTAAGIASVTSSIELQSKHLGTIDAMIMNGSPDVISMGRRCVEEGYGFHWYPFQAAPYIDKPKDQGGGRIYTSAV